jgi:autotransporter-associated beta strand protein
LDGAFNATLTVNPNTGTLGNDITVAAGNTGVLTITSSNNGIFSGDIALNSSVNLNTTANTTTITGLMTGSGTVTKIGSAALQMESESTFSGGIVLNAGTLRINNGGTSTASALGTGTFTIRGGTIDNNSGQAVVVATNNQQVWDANFTFGGSNDLDLGTGDISLGTAVGTSRTITTNGTGVLTVGGTISDGTTATGLTKAGTGTLVLNGANTFTGGVIVTAGTLLLGHNEAPGGGKLDFRNAVTVASDSATSRIFDNNVDLSVSTVLTIGAGGDLTFGELRLVSGTRTIIVNNAVTTFANTANDATARTLTKSGDGAMVVLGNAQHGGSIITAGILAVPGAYTSTGNINLQGGIIGLNGSFTRNLGTAASQTQFTASGGWAATGTQAAWGDAANNLSVSIAGGGLLTFGGTGNFLASGQTLLLGHAISNGTVTVHNPLNLAADDQTVQVARGATASTNGIDARLAGAIGSSGGGLIKTGLGTLELAAANDYTGATQVIGGKLKVTGTLGSGSVTVASGAVLELDVATAIDDGAGLTLGEGAVANLLFDSSLFESVSSLTLGDVTYTTGIFNADSHPTYFTGTGNVAVPEPASLGLFAIGALGLLKRRRRA